MAKKNFIFTSDEETTNDDIDAFCVEHLGADFDDKFNIVKVVISSDKKKITMEATLT